MHGFQAFEYAQAMRDVVREIAQKEVRRMRPAESYATVSTINEAANTANVTFPGDTTSVPVKMFTVRPTSAGDVVRIEGESTRRYISEVVSGIRSIRSGRLTLTALQSAGASANMYADAITGAVTRITSSLRYKKNVKQIAVSDETVLRLNAIQYEPKSELDCHNYIGLIAEEIAVLEDPVLEMLVTRDFYGKPDAVNYDRLAVVLLPVVQRLIRRVQELEDRHA